jgi:molybdenum cofactor cytidylyltransferase
MNPPGYAAIILSAGLSSRMSRFKPLLKLNGLALIDRAIGLFPPELVDVYVVSGHRREELKGHIVNPAVSLIENPDYLKGMYSSVRAGLRGLKKDYGAFFILPVDIPLVRPFTIRRILELSKNNPDRILYPVFNGKRGHPPLIPSRIIPFILESSGEGGLKAVLGRSEESALEIKVPDRFILTDMDTDSDYDSICRDFAFNDIPNAPECEAILDICEVDSSRRLHCLKVAQIAALIGAVLLKSGHAINPELVRVAATLHDIAKGRHQHDIAGGGILRDMGFERVADIVAVHTFLPENRKERSLEATLVYLADKLVQGDRLVSLDERFQISNRPFEVTPEIEKNISERKRRANEVKKELEEMIGKPLESIINQDRINDI